MNSFKNSIYLPPAVVFLAVLLVTILAFSAANNAHKQDRQQVMAEYTTEVNDIISDRVNIFEETLLSGAGLFSTDENVTKQDWESYMQTVGVMDRYPGSQGIGYARYFTAVQKDDVEESSKNTISREFKIYPEGKREQYTAILYISPLDDRNERAIGYDMFSEVTRRRAMAAARDSGEVHISDPVRLVQEDGKDDQEGFLMYAAQYSSIGETVNQRRAALEGYVYGVFRANTFFESILENKLQNNIAIQITSGTEENEILYESDNFKTLTVNSPHITKTFEAGGKESRWVIEYVFNDALLLANKSSVLQPLTVLLFGVFSSALISLTTYLLLSRKSKEIELANERDINDAKDNLLSIASHQLRTPATGVKQYLGMVLHGFTGDVNHRQEEMLQKAYDSNERQLKTINEVLYLARLESGRIILSKQEVELTSLVQSIIDEQRDSIEENGHTVTYHAPKNAVKIMADEHMLRMSIENLLSNAIKYTVNSGRIDIRIRRNKQNVRISIKDSGVGISEQDSEKLFKQFSRIPNNLTKSVSGTGIGLYLAMNLINKHDGTIELDSKLGLGSTFTIVLPR